MNDPLNSYAGKKDILLLIKKFGIDGPVSINAVNSGVINDTYIVESTVANQKYILQKLHKIFSYNLLYDFEAVTAHLVQNGIITPRLINTAEGLPAALDEGKAIWRMMTFVPGRTISSGSPETAKSAGELLARFHTALLNFDYKFKHRIEGFHDAETNIEKLKRAVSGNNQPKKYEDLEGLTRFVIDEFESEEFNLSLLPLRVIHGDPKISNFIFDSVEDTAVCLIDLDTVSNCNLAVELGDAIRSWCQVKEGNCYRFDKDIFSAFLEGYFLFAKFLTNQEISAIIDGVKIVTLDLCARYITDAFEEVYFKLDYSRFESLYEQNRIKASNLVSFYREIQTNVNQLNSIIKSF